MADNITPFSQEPETVLLGAKVYPLREVPIARLRRFRNAFEDLTAKVNGTLNGGDLEQGSPDAVNMLFDLVLEEPAKVLAIAIPELANDAEAQAALLDEDDGVTIPQLIRAFDRALEVNGLGFLKASLPFIGTVVRVWIGNWVTRPRTPVVTEPTPTDANSPKTS